MAAASNGLGPLNAKKPPRKIPGWLFGGPCYEHGRAGLIVTLNPQRHAGISRSLRV